jgi:hypothetical protein
MFSYNMTMPVAFNGARYIWNFIDEGSIKTWTFAA